MSGDLEQLKQRDKDLGADEEREESLVSVDEVDMGAVAKSDNSEGEEAEGAEGAEAEGAESAEREVEVSSKQEEAEGSKAVAEDEGDGDKEGADDDDDDEEEEVDPVRAAKIAEMQAAATALAPKHRQFFRQLFVEHDADGGGSIDAEELGPVMHALGVQLDEKELDACVKLVDIDGNGSLDFDEFLMLAASMSFADKAARKARLDVERAGVKEKFAPDQLQMFGDCFELFDKSGDGSLDTREMGPLMRSLNMDCTVQELQNLIYEVDVDGDGELDFEEFLLLMGRLTGREDEQTLIKAFKVFDKDDSGIIDVKHLREVLGGKGEAMSAEELDDLMLLADLENNGKVEYAKFCALMFSLDDE